MDKIKIIKNQKGGVLLGFLIGFLMLMIVVSLFIRVFPLYDTYSRLDTFGKEVMRTAELSGRIDSEVTNKVVAMKSITKIDPTLHWNVTGQIDLGDEIILNLELKEQLIFGGVTFEIPMKIQLSGRSEVYWK